MSYRREIPISVSIDITLKDKNMGVSKEDYSREILDFENEEPVEHVFRFCLSVLLEQDAYGEEEIEKATRIISELTNHEDGFNITSKEA